MRGGLTAFPDAEQESRDYRASVRWQPPGNPDTLDCPEPIGRMDLLWLVVGADGHESVLAFGLD